MTSSRYSDRNRLYRSRHGMFLGLCDGIARWKDIPVFWVRAAVVVAASMTGVIPVLIVYIILSLTLDTSPGEGETRSSNKGDFNRQYRRNREAVVDGIKEEYRDIKRRMQRMENDVVNREQDWEDRFRKETD